MSDFLLTQTGLPEALRAHFDALKKALTTEYPMTRKADEDEEGEAYREARQPEAIGRVLVCHVHRHLKNYEVGYLYREKIERNGRTVLGKASKVGAKLKHFSNLDFLIEINRRAWAVLSQRQRVALVDHELAHCGTETTEDGEDKLVMIAHDLEEFNAIVQRWGIWQPDIAAFAKVLQQPDLWDSPPPTVDKAGVHEIQDAARG